MFFFGWRGDVLVAFFFFSSRRRHTRCLSDWSSDVCSSDLKDQAPCSSNSLSLYWPRQVVGSTKKILSPVRSKSCTGPKVHLRSLSGTACCRNPAFHCAAASLPLKT